MVYQPDQYQLFNLTFLIMERNHGQLKLNINGNLALGSFNLMIALNC